MRSEQAADQIRPLAWRAAQRGDPIEVLGRRELLDRYSLEHFQSVERLQFHLVILGEQGTGTHEIDFVDTEIRPRRLIHLEPGQVQRWRPSSQFDARLVLFPDVPPGVSPRWGMGTAIHDLEPSQVAQVNSVLDLIDEERKADRGHPGREIALRALRDLVFVRMGLATDPDDRGAALPPAYVALREDLEAHLTVAPTMQERGDRIGYSARTISRACLDVDGRTAKQVVDERIILEARRLLSQPLATSSSVAITLGFSEPTNFAKFFRRHTTVTPTDWIESVRPTR